MNILDILKQNEYFISYNNTEENTAKIRISFLDEKEFFLSYKKDTSLFVSNWNDLTINGPDYIGASIAYLIVLDICSQYKYPTILVEKLLNGNPVNEIHFLNTNNDKSQDMLDLTKDILVNGLTGEQVEIAEAFDLFEGLKIICNLSLKINISPV